MGKYDALFQPLRIKGLEIRNRFLSTSHAPAYEDNGRITDRAISPIRRRRPGVASA
jgi:2,4-dienoyl-CoA reductase-like NADH-dependent reductase (Old Yellow Enzyme family)